MRSLLVICCLSLFPALTMKSAQCQEPEPAEPAVAESEYGAMPEPRRTRAMAAAYYSPSMGAKFYTQWLYINTNQGRYTFWGARIVGLDDNSPLHELGLNLGDVITRLDGMRISDRMRRRQHPQTGEWYYQLPEMERHYGNTAVRYVKTGTHSVREGHIDLGPLGGNNPDGGGPLAP